MLDEAGSPFNWRSPVEWERVRCEHLVQWYDNDGILIQAVGGFLSAAVRQDGGAAILIATKAHTAAIEQWLEADGLGVRALERSGRFVSLDARTTLDRLMVDGAPDRGRFREVIGVPLSRAATSWNVLHAFGEMVALLVEDGNVDGAIALENLWNELHLKNSFSLLCGYPNRNLACGDDAELFARVCTAHSTVIL